MAGMGRAAAAGESPRDARLDFVPESARAYWDGPGVAEFGRTAGQAVHVFIRLVRMLHDAGVTLMVGTDLATPYVFAGSSVHDEMRFFARAGIPAADILRDATIVPARFLGIDDRLGSIVPRSTACSRTSGLW